MFHTPRPALHFRFFCEESLDNSYVEIEYRSRTAEIATFFFGKKEPEFLSLESLYAVIIKNTDLSL